MTNTDLKVKRKTSKFEILSDVASHKIFAESIQKQISTFLKGEKGQRVLDCGNFLMLNHYHDPNDTHKVGSANFCKNKLCPFCSWREHLKIFEPLRYAVEQLEGNLYHIVLTIPNVNYITKQFFLDLREKAVSFIRKVMNIETYLMSFEITISKTGEFHPHFHILALCNEIKARRYLQAEWARYLGNGHTWCMLNVQKASPETVHELTKYIVKFESKETPTERLKQIYFATKGLRRYSLAGDLKKLYKFAKVYIKNKNQDELTELLKYGEPEQEFYNWIGGNYEKMP